MSAFVTIYNGSGAPQLVDCPNEVTIPAGSSVSLYTATLEFDGTVYTVDDAVSYSFVIGSTQDVLTREHDFTPTFWTAFGMGFGLFIIGIMVRMLLKPTKAHTEDKELL